MFCEIKGYSTAPVVFFVFFVFLPLIGYLYSLFFRYDKGLRVIFYGVIPFYLFILFSFCFSKTENFFVAEKVKVVVNAKIVGKSGGKVTHVKFRERSGNKIYTYTLPVGNSEYRKVRNGDTALVMMYPECRNIKQVFNLLPTQKEIDKCRNGCYSYEGELFTKEEIEKAYPELTEDL